MHAALEPRVKVSLSTSTSQHLSFDDQIILAYSGLNIRTTQSGKVSQLTKVFGNLFRLCCGECWQRFWGGNAVLLVISSKWTPSVLARVMVCPDQGIYRYLGVELTWFNSCTD